MDHVRSVDDRSRPPALKARSLGFASPIRKKGNMRRSRSASRLNSARSTRSLTSNRSCSSLRAEPSQREKDMMEEERLQRVESERLKGILKRYTVQAQATQKWEVEKLRLKQEQAEREAKLNGERQERQRVEREFQERRAKEKAAKQKAEDDRNYQRQLAMEQKIKLYSRKIREKRVADKAKARADSERRKEREAARRERIKVQEEQQWREAMEKRRHQDARQRALVQKREKMRLEDILKHRKTRELKKKASQAILEKQDAAMEQNRQKMLGALTQAEKRRERLDQDMKTNLKQKSTQANQKRRVIIQRQQDRNQAEIRQLRDHMTAADAKARVRVRQIHRQKVEAVQKKKASLCSKLEAARLNKQKLQLIEEEWVEATREEVDAKRKRTDEFMHMKDHMLQNRMRHRLASKKRQQDMQHFLDRITKTPGAIECILQLGINFEDPDTVLDPVEVFDKIQDMLAQKQGHQSPLPQRLQGRRRTPPAGKQLAPLGKSASGAMRAINMGSSSGDSPRKFTTTLDANGKGSYKASVMPAFSPENTRHIDGGLNAL